MLINRRNDKLQYIYSMEHYKSVKNEWTRSIVPTRIEGKKSKIKKTSFKMCIPWHNHINSWLNLPAHLKKKKVPGTVLSSLYKKTHLLFTTTLCGRHFYYPDLIDEDNEAQKNFKTCLRSQNY